MSGRNAQYPSVRKRRLPEKQWNCADTGRIYPAYFQADLEPERISEAQTAASILAQNVEFAFRGRPTERAWSRVLADASPVRRRDPPGYPMNRSERPPPGSVMVLGTRSPVAGCGSGPTAMSRRSARFSFPPRRTGQCLVSLFARVLAHSTPSGPSAWKVMAVPYLMSRSGVV